jgi:hypothetical protein
VKRVRGNERCKGEGKKMKSIGREKESRKKDEKDGNAKINIY